MGCGQEAPFDCSRGPCSTNLSYGETKVLLAGVYFLPPPRIVFSNQQHHPTRHPGSPRSTSDSRVPQTRIYLPSSFFLRTRRRAHRLPMAGAEAPALAPSEPITTVSDGRALSADGRSHQGSDPTHAADSHQGARAGAHAPAPHGDLSSPDAPAPPRGRRGQHWPASTCRTTGVARTQPEWAATGRQSPCEHPLLRERGVSVAQAQRAAAPLLPAGAQTGAARGATGGARGAGTSAFTPLADLPSK